MASFWWNTCVFVLISIILPLGRDHAEVQPYTQGHLHRSVSRLAILQEVGMSNEMSSTSSSDVKPNSEENVFGLKSNHIHHPSPFLGSEENEKKWDASTTAMVIVNSPISSPPSPLFDFLWEASSFRVCADGGANRLYLATVNSGSSKVYTPSLITGDLDSLQDRVRSYYGDARGVPIVKYEDQDLNDLDKSLESVPKGYTSCFVFGAFGGRLDQEMASLQVLFKHRERFENLWLYDDRSAAILLQPGAQHVLRFPNWGKEKIEKRAIGEGPTCGLIPIGTPSERVTTSGLQWNLASDRLAFGELVSTSNRIVESQVVVETSHPLLFTVEVEAGILDPAGW